MNYILNANGIALFINGKPVSVSKEDQKYAKVIQALRLPSEKQEAAVVEALKGVNCNEKLSTKGFVIKGETVSYQGEELPAPLAKKVISLIRENLPVELLENFWKNLKLNPASSSIRELYDFLAYKELPITEDGCFVAYRGLRGDYYSVNGNLSTKVLKGKVDSTGHIYNGVGEEIEIERNNVDDNRDNCCSFGVHAGSYDYASGWSQGKLVAVKINPKDVVSVPKDYNCQKLRCCAYKVIAEISQEIEAVATDEKGVKIDNPFFAKAKIERNKIVDRISAYLSRKAQSGKRFVKIKAIQSIFSPDCPSVLEICDAVQALGYKWMADKREGKIVKLR